MDNSSPKKSHEIMILSIVCYKIDQFSTTELKLQAKM